MKSLNSRLPLVLFACVAGGAGLTAAVALVLLGTPASDLGGGERIEQTTPAQVVAQGSGELQPWRSGQISFPKDAEALAALDTALPTIRQEPRLLDEIPAALLRPPKVIPKEIEFTVPEGARLPAVLVDTDDGEGTDAAFDPDDANSSNRASLVDFLAFQFAQRVAAAESESAGTQAAGTSGVPQNAPERAVAQNQPASAEMPSGDPAQATHGHATVSNPLWRWEEAAYDADERFRALFGEAAFLRNNVRQDLPVGVR